MPEKQVRSFRGCLGCKKAKRRCSEDRPVCRLCAKTGRLCEVHRLTAMLIQYNTDSLFRFTYAEETGVECKPLESKDVIFRPPVAKECIVDDIDFPYFSFFLEKMPSYFEYTAFFPEVCPILLARSTSHSARSRPATGR